VVNQRLEFSQIQLLGKALTSHCGVRGYSMPKEFSGWKPELLCTNSPVPPLICFAGGGRANVILFKYADGTHPLAICLIMDMIAMTLQSLGHGALCHKEANWELRLELR
jgi:hypothetical protein